MENKKDKFKNKKSLGQNFLIDLKVLEKIIDISNINKDTLVLEVGTGTGVLTKELASRAGQVISYEIDKTLKKILFKNTQKIENLEIIFEDFLKANLKEVMKGKKYKDIYIIANIPYYIATPIINKIINDNIKPSKMVLMVQKEYGKRLAAKSGTRDYGSLTVFLNYYFDVQIEFDVPKESFYPIPKVDSVIVSFNKKTNKTLVNDEEKLFKFVQESFSQKRKKIKNNLRHYDLEKINNILLQRGKSIDCRAEELTLDDYIAITKSIV